MDKDRNEIINALNRLGWSYSSTSEKVAIYSKQFHLKIPMNCNLTEYRIQIANLMESLARLENQPINSIFEGEKENGK